jgi:hypothetical protein
VIRVGRRMLEVPQALDVVRTYPRSAVLLYDLADDPEGRVEGSDVIGLGDVGRLAALGVRLTPEWVVGMLDVARLLRWERLGDEPFLEDADPEKEGGLFEAMTLVEEQLRTESGVDVRTASALLHLKRPHLFPLLAPNAVPARSWAAIREDMLANEQAMIELTLAIQADPELDLFTRIPNLRLYDILSNLGTQPAAG